MDSLHDKINIMICMVSKYSDQPELPWVGPEGAGGPALTPIKYIVTIGVFRTSGTDHPRVAIGPHRSNCYSSEFRKSPCEITVKTFSVPTPTP